MSYPSGPPGNPGYPSGSPQAHYSAPTQQFGQVQDAAPAGPSKLPMFLDVAVAALGVAVYLTTFGFDAPITDGGVAAVLAGLLAGFGLLPKQNRHPAVVAALSVLGLLIVLSLVVAVGSGAVWAVYLLLGFTALQAIAAVTALLLDAGVVTAPVPKPKYEQHPYGQYGAPYYGQPQHGGPSLQSAPPQRPGYPQQYAGYPNGPSTGGFNAPQPPQTAVQSGPPTPPTGFPAFGQPQGAMPAQSQPQPQESYEPQQQTPQAASPSAPPPS